jgi:lambda family phage minor tail protein L
MCIPVLLFLGEYTMTDIIETVQLQEPGYALIHLYELDLNDGIIVRFFSGVDSTLSEIQFPDSQGTAQTYSPIPLYSSGFDINSDGAYNRPELIIANIEDTLRLSLGQKFSFESLIGKRITRRSTLEKYLDLVSYPNAVEFPKISYIIDNIKEKNPITVTFDLAAPFDLQGVKLPGRTIIGGSCPWKYKGARKDLPPNEREGGCVYTDKMGMNVLESFFITDPPNCSDTNNFINKYDEIVLVCYDTSVIPIHIPGPYLAGDTVYTTSLSTLILSDGALVENQTVYDYWSCLEDTSTVPSDNNTAWLRFRVAIPSGVNNDTVVKGYTNKKYNEYLVNDGVGVWHKQVRSRSFVSSAIWFDPYVPGENNDLVIDADVCGKTLTSCKLRFGRRFTPGSARGKVQNKPLPFGGFPGVQQRR